MIKACLYQFISSLYFCKQYNISIFFEWLGQVFMVNLREVVSVNHSPSKIIYSCFVIVKAMKCYRIFGPLVDLSNK